MTGTPPTDWIGVLGLAVVVVGNWIDTRRVHGQVANHHSGNNLRDDIDELKKGQTAMSETINDAITTIAGFDQRLRRVENRGPA